MELDDQVRYVLSRPATQRTRPDPVVGLTQHKQFTPVNINDQRAQTDSGVSNGGAVDTEAHLAQNQELSEETSCADRPAQSTDALTESDSRQDTSVQSEQVAMEELEVGRSRRKQDPLAAGKSNGLTADGIDKTSGTKTEALGERREERERTVTFQEAAMQLSSPTEHRGDSTGKDTRVGISDGMRGSSAGGQDEKGQGETAVHGGESGQTGQVTKVTVSCVQRPQTVGGEVHTRHPTPQQR